VGVCIGDCGAVYRHFAKHELVLAFLELREHRWTLGWIEAEARARGTTPEAQLFAIFDVFDEWFRSEDFEGCSFINVLLEMSAEADLQRASALYLKNIRSIVGRLAEDTGLRDPGSFAHSWHILNERSIVAAAEGDVEAAQRAKSMAQLLIEQHRG